ncbi:hypothetical protein [Paenibacillus polymyxa]|uniref:hypothetical protein n=1 Tax=Paenibacillus polymyxa TaxID=1406 RepID=UPI0023792AA8|nr:hypothetical protein [Paenibacillus polymyxa]WDM20653.1 hypothetical protein J4I02_16635 [Paenibacillus polymyxa]
MVIEKNGEEGRERSVDGSFFRSLLPPDFFFVNKLNRVKSGDKGERFFRTIPSTPLLPTTMGHFFCDVGVAVRVKYL